MIISHRHRFIFLKTQKTAGSSVELALSEICGPDDVITRMKSEDGNRGEKRLAPQNFNVPSEYQPWLASVPKMLGMKPRRIGLEFFQHMPAAKIRRRMNPHLFDSYRKVTIVRNAWDREVSLYFWATRNLRRKPSFDRFVRRRVWRPEMKTFHIYSIDGVSVADTVLHYETLAEDFATFVASLGLKSVPELPRAKGNFRSKVKTDYKSFYTDATAEIVRRRYAREISLYSMEF